MSKPTEITEYILCAAVWYNDGVGRVHLPRNIKTGLVVAGWRHANCIAQLTALLNELPLADRDEKRIHIIQNQTQGFLTSKGNFLDRTDALILAKERGQLIEVPNGNELFSENIY